LIPWGLTTLPMGKRFFSIAHDGGSEKVQNSLIPLKRDRFHRRGIYWKNQENLCNLILKPV